MQSKTFIIENDLSTMFNIVSASFRISEYEGAGFKLIFTVLTFNKKNYIDWTMKIKNLLEIQGV